VSETKNIKVKILPEVSVFMFKETAYHPGDVLEVPEIIFRAHIMEKVEPKPEPPVETVEPVEKVEAEKPESEPQTDEETPAEKTVEPEAESSHVEISRRREKPKRR